MEADVGEAMETEGGVVSVTTTAPGGGSFQVPWLEPI